MKCFAGNNFSQQVLWFFFFILICISIALSGSTCLAWFVNKKFHDPPWYSKLLKERSWNYYDFEILFLVILLFLQKLNLVENRLNSYWGMTQWCPWYLKGGKWINFSPLTEKSHSSIFSNKLLLQNPFVNNQLLQIILSSTFWTDQFLFSLIRSKGSQCTMWKYWDMSFKLYSIACLHFRVIPNTRTHTTDD